MARILLVEDNESSAEFVRTWLTGERHVLEIARDGGEALEYLQSEFDVVLLDWDLPDMSGLQILKHIRSQGKSVPIIMLTGKSEITDKEMGLDSGADDYLAKPFDLTELSARIRVQLRRGSKLTQNTISIGELKLDPVGFRVTWKDQEVNLLPKEFSLLEFFMRNPDRMFSAEAILQRLWNLDSEASTNAFRSALKRLRQKLVEAGVPENVVETVHGAGFRLNSKLLTQG